MRLLPAERQAIVEEIRKRIPEAAVYLYGSRVDDQLKGGDIDLLVIAPQPVDFSTKVDILIDIKARIGEQRIDLKITAPGEAKQDAFIQSVLPRALPLN